MPWGLDLAAAWSWRVIVIGAAGLAVLWLLSYFAVITLPLIIALLIAALNAPLVQSLKRFGIPEIDQNKIPIITPGPGQPPPPEDDGACSVEPLMPSLAIVAGPTMPSTSSPLRAWNALTALRVCGP